MRLSEQSLELAIGFKEASKNFIIIFILFHKAAAENLKTTCTLTASTDLIFWLIFVFFTVLSSGFGLQI
jgi:hypothetical protein